MLCLFIYFVFLVGRGKLCVYLNLSAAIFTDRIQIANPQNSNHNICIYLTFVLVSHFSLPAIHFNRFVLNIEPLIEQFRHLKSFNSS